MFKQSLKESITPYERRVAGLASQRLCSSIGMNHHWLMTQCLVAMDAAERAGLLCNPRLPQDRVEASFYKLIINELTAKITGEGEKIEKVVDALLKRSSRKLLCQVPAKPAALTENWLRLRRLIKQRGQDDSRLEIMKEKKKWTDRELKKITHSIDIVRKQMILQEVFLDIIKAKEILVELAACDGGALNDPTKSLNKQKYRDQFNRFVVQHLRERYSNQLGLLYG